MWLSLILQWVQVHTALSWGFARRIPSAENKVAKLRHELNRHRYTRVTIKSLGDVNKSRQRHLSFAKTLVRIGEHHA